MLSHRLLRAIYDFRLRAALVILLSI